MSRVTDLSARDQQLIAMINFTYNARIGLPARSVGMFRLAKQYSDTTRSVYFDNGMMVVAYRGEAGSTFGRFNLFNRVHPIDSAVKILQPAKIIFTGDGVGAEKAFKEFRRWRQKNRPVQFVGFYDNKPPRVTPGPGIELVKVPAYFFNNHGRQIGSDLRFYDKFTNSAQKTLSQYGDWFVTKVTVYRTALPQQLITIANHISNGTWNEAMKKYGYDKFFHLGLVLEVESRDGRRQRILLEKNEVIYITTEQEFVNESTDYFPVPVTNRLAQTTLSKLVENTKQVMGTEKFFGYNAFTNNCQIFVMNVLQANGVDISPAMKEFIFQDLTGFSGELPQATQGTVHFLTDLRRVINKITRA